MIEKTHQAVVLLIMSWSELAFCAAEQHHEHVDNQLRTARSQHHLIQVQQKDLQAILECQILHTVDMSHASALLKVSRTCYPLPRHSNMDAVVT